MIKSELINEAVHVEVKGTTWEVLNELKYLMNNMANSDIIQNNSPFIIKDLMEILDKIATSLYKTHMILKDICEDEEE